MKTFMLSVLLTISLSAFAQDATEEKVPAYGCVPSGHWVSGKINASFSVHHVIPKTGVLLAGETHTDMPTHLWQYYLVVEAYNKNPDMVITMESFPRSSQPILDKWVAGEYATLKDFYTAVNWQSIWGYDITYYEPILRFAKQNNIRIIGMNVDKVLIKSVKSFGWDNTSDIFKEGISTPEKASRDYFNSLLFTYKMHKYEDKEGAPSIINFITAQTVWDRAFAESIAEQYKQDKLVIAIVGQGHVQYGWGIKHQLASMGVYKVFTLLPWSKSYPCEYWDPESADIFYGI